MQVGGVVAPPPIGGGGGNGGGEVHDRPVGEQHAWVGTAAHAIGVRGWRPRDTGADQEADRPRRATGYGCEGAARGAARRATGYGCEEAARGAAHGLSPLGLAGGLWRRRVTGRHATRCTRKVRRFVPRAVPVASGAPVAATRVVVAVTATPRVPVVTTVALS